jgi:NitT/TauT family transport system permease protein/putative hydroxymethylpyrimidine transport system permease protein
VTVLARSWRAAAVLLLVLAVWELYVDLGGADPLILPPPHAVAVAVVHDRGLLWRNFLVSAEEIVLGIGLAALTGLLFAIALHLSERTLRPAVYPLLIASQTVPIALLAPVLVFWLGFGLLPKLIVIAVVSFFSIVVTTLGGLSGVDADLLKLMRTLEATRLQTLRHVELPAALPGLFTGTKIAVVVAPIAAVLAEQAGSGSGLGYVFQQALAQLLTARMCAAVAILSLFAVMLFALLTLLERWALPWAHTSTESTATP